MKSWRVKLLATYYKNVDGVDCDDALQRAEEYFDGNEDLDNVEAVDAEKREPGGDSR